MLTAMTAPEHGNIKIQRVQLDNIELEYIDVGKGPAVLFLHGALTNLTNWFSVLPFLTKRYRCIIPTLPLGAHNFPAVQNTDLSVEGVADIVSQFIQRLNVSDVHVVGNDTGGVYAQMLAVQSPALVRSVLLSNCDALDVFPPKAFSTLPKAVSIPGYLKIMSWLFNFPTFVASPFALGLLSKSMSAEALKKPLQSFIDSSKIRLDFKHVAQSWHSDTTLRLASELTRSEKPIALIWGEADEVLFPFDFGKKLAAALGNVDILGVPDASAYVHCDQPALFAKHLLAFLDSVEKEQGGR